MTPPTMRLLKTDHWSDIQVNDVRPAGCGANFVSLRNRSIEPHSRSDTLSNMIEALADLESSALASLSSIQDAPGLEAWRVEHLGSKGALKSVMGMMKDVPKEQKPLAGQRANEVKQRLEGAFQERKANLEQASSPSALLDPTEPGLPPGRGRRHPISTTVDAILDVFGRMGFEVAHGPEVEDEWHNFNALNIPADHPARDPVDNFYMGGSEDDVTRLLRTQTSTVQIRTMEAHKPPLRIVAAGRVYRPDTHDATHYSMFHQVEGLCIDEGVSMVDLKTSLMQFARAMFGPEAEARMRPSFFPFTEPSAEVDMKITVKGKTQWMEIGGCGMVDPAVLEAVGIDPERYTGFAFGLGVERIAMRRYGIADIRWMYENDARFLDQF